MGRRKASTDCASAVATAYAWRTCRQQRARDASGPRMKVKLEPWSSEKRTAAAAAGSPGAEDAESIRWASAPSCAPLPDPPSRAAMPCRSGGC